MEDSTMGIGYRELIVLVFLLLVPLIVIGVVIWLATRRSRRSSLPPAPRAAADRLAELESLRRAGQISTDEYEKQRASVISSI
jgi:uncharacterized membrane protein